MKNKNKALVLVLSAGLIAMASVFSTLAYLTDTDTATNTFTVGDVDISLDEINYDGKDDAGNDSRLRPIHAPHLFFRTQRSWNHQLVLDGTLCLSAAVYERGGCGSAVCARVRRGAGQEAYVWRCTNPVRAHPGADDDDLWFCACQ